MEECSTSATAGSMSGPSAILFERPISSSATLRKGRGVGSAAKKVQEAPRAPPETLVGGFFGSAHAGILSGSSPGLLSSHLT